MKIANLEVFPVRLPIHNVLTLPRGPSRTIDEGKRVAVVKLTADDGTVGWGEAGPSRRWSAETIESCATSIRNYFSPVIVGHDAFDIAGLHERMNRELATGADVGQPIAKSAIDIAAHDLICRKLGISLADYLGAKRVPTVDLACLVSAADPDSATSIVAAGLAGGYRGFKVKVGSNVRNDADILSAVVAAAQGAFVWPDANQGYSTHDAIVLAGTCERLGITVFEQPIAANNLDGLRRLIAATPVTIALDEGAVSIPAVLELLRHGLVPGLVIKVSKLGGIHYARQLCDIALNAGITLFGSGLMDAPIGFMAGVHVFCAYGITFPVDLNGPQFIVEDYLAQAITLDRQQASVPAAPGLGIEVDEARLRRFAFDSALIKGGAVLT